MKITKLSKILNKLYKKICKVDDFPDEYIPKGTVIMGGSDAHFARDIGTHLKIEAPDAKDYDDLFEKIIDPKYKRSFTFRKFFLPMPIYSLVKGVNSFLEGFIKIFKMK